jgi:serine/threonine protein phosphatase PrpC
MNDDDSTGAPRRLTLPVPGPLDSPPPSVDVEVSFGARSRRGPLRPINDDHYLIMRLGRDHETLMTSLPDGDVPARFAEHGYAMVIADGLGSDGDTASRLAISTLVHLAIDFGKWHMRINELIADEMTDRADRFFRSIDATLLRASEGRARGLHTTMTAVYSAGAELFFAHVGHSRAYLWRDDRLMPLTHDHTLARVRSHQADLVDVAASAQDQQHIVTETLGRTGPPRVDIERCGLQDGDLILLCSNGLTDVAADARIADALRAHYTADEQCRALMDLAAHAGATDDVTALVAQYRIRTLAPGV